MFHLQQNNHHTYINEKQLLLYMHNRAEVFNC